MNDVIKKIVERGDEAFAKAQQHKDDQWNVDGMLGGDIYEITFEHFLGDDFGFEDWAEERKKRGLGTHVLDFLGGAYIFDDFSNVDSITGVRLFNMDDALVEKYSSGNRSAYLERLTKVMDNKKRRIVEGNIYRHSTWVKIMERLKEVKSQAVDLMVMRPIAGLKSEENIEDLKDATELYFQMFKKAYVLLSNKDGMMLAEVPTTLRDYCIQFVEKLDAVEGISAEYDVETSTMKIVKSQNAPKSLKSDILQD